MTVRRLMSYRRNYLPNDYLRNCANLRHNCLRSNGFRRRNCYRLSGCYRTNASCLCSKSAEQPSCVRWTPNYVLS